MEKEARISGIYGIVDPEAVAGRNALDIAKYMLRAGIKVIQLRAKNLSTRDFFLLAEKMRGLTRQSAALFIVNDRLDVALAAGADGVHLGQGDLPIELARKIADACPSGAGEKLIIGLSTHSLEEAQAGQAAGADYIGFGAIYSTGSKKDVTRPQGPARLARIVRAVSIPVIAIGGINEQNLAEVKNTAAAGAAIISALCAGPDVEAAGKKMIDIW